jgi:hypothetical protein
VPVLSLHLQAAPSRTQENQHRAFSDSKRSRMMAANWYGFIQMHESTCGSMFVTEPFEARKS